MRAGEAMADNRILSRKIAFTTPWFDVVAKQTSNDTQPFYALRMTDYVSVVAFTKADELVLVRQYRPVVERYTIELPSGHVEANETPQKAAERELEEECGLVGTMKLLGTLISDTGRNENRLWCYLAQEVLPANPRHVAEIGVQRLFVPRNEIGALIRESRLEHALDLAALMLVFTNHVGLISAR